MRVFALVMMIVAPTLSHTMEVVVSAEVQTPPRPTIYGSSNLPDGTKLAVIVTRQESAYRAEALTEVKSGRSFSRRQAQRLDPDTEETRTRGTELRRSSRGRYRAVHCERWPRSEGARQQGRCRGTPSVSSFEFAACYRVLGHTKLERSVSYRRMEVDDHWRLLGRQV